jgi:hypothetical protein
MRGNVAARLTRPIVFGNRDSSVFNRIVKKETLPLFMAVGAGAVLALWFGIRHLTTSPDVQINKLARKSTVGWTVEAGAHGRARADSQQPARRREVGQAPRIHAQLGQGDRQAGKALKHVRQTGLARGTISISKALRSIPQAPLLSIEAAWGRHGGISTHTHTQT